MANRGRQSFNLMTLRLIENEDRAVKRCAEIAGLNKTAWIRSRIRMSAAKELREVGEDCPFLFEDLKANAKRAG